MLRSRGPGWRSYADGAPTAQSIQIFRWDAGTALSAATQITAITLPRTSSSRSSPGLPNGAATVPDGFGNATVAIDFDQNVAGAIKNQVMFMPDGSAHDVNGNLNSGILYLARNGDLYSSRAVTLYGATGRIRGWRLLSLVAHPNGISSEDKDDAQPTTVTGGKQAAGIRHCLKPSLPSLC